MPSSVHASYSSPTVPTESSPGPWTYLREGVSRMRFTTTPDAKSTAAARYCGAMPCEKARENMEASEAGGGAATAPAAI